MILMMWTTLPISVRWLQHLQWVMLDDITDLMGLDLPSRQCTTESYANARAVNQLNLPRDINILFFKTKVQKDAYFGHLVKKNIFKH